MKKNLLTLLSILCIGVSSSWAQDASTYNIIIKGGHVIDPKNNIDAVMDVAIKDGKIVKIAKTIDATGAVQTVDAKGMYVTPGLIDIHTHVFWGTDLQGTYRDGPNDIAPDGFTLRNGVTTIVDAGSSGWKTFEKFKKQTIDRSITRVFSELNIVGEGMAGGRFENNLEEMDAAKTAEMAKKYPENIVGVKLAHFSGHDWTPTDRAVEAGTLANIPVMVDFGGSNPPLSIEELFFKHLRPGDIFTHAYAQLGGSRESIVDITTQKVKPFVYEARKRGIIFDVGYGGISFAFSQAIPAIKQGFLPSSISTDLHIESMNAAMKDMLTCMDKIMALGVDLKTVIAESTWNPAQEIKHPELGNLSEGAEADVAILSVRDGKFGLFDYTGYKVSASKRLECQMTIRNGRIVYDLNGIANPIVAPRQARSDAQRARRSQTH